MPYYFDSYDAPEATNLEIDSFLEMWELIKNDLLSVVFEEQEDALSAKYRSHKDTGDFRYLDWSLARYRKTDDREMLLYYHELGLEALAYTENALRETRLDANLLYYWGMLSACHGYVMNACLAVGNDLASERAGAAGREATSLERHKQWFSHYYLRERPHCRNREETLVSLESLINAITDGDIPEIDPAQFEWFERFLSLDEFVAVDGSGEKVANPRYEKLTKVFRKELSEKAMKELVDLPSDDLPPLDLEIPPPLGGDAD